jgi:cytidylate kinase
VTDPMQPTKRISIAVDGPGSSGKGTVARGIARALQYQYVDTGAMYRTIALLAKEAGIRPNDAEALATLAADLKFQFLWDGDVLRIRVGDRDVTGAIRTDEVGRLSSEISSHPEVRRALLALQQALGAEGGIVMDGRDIGTVILPKAEMKIYLDCALDERARRRHEEFMRRGEVLSFAEVREALAHRDEQDTRREVAPLRQADDAVYVDTSKLTIREAIGMLLALARLRGA